MPTINVTAKLIEYGLPSAPVREGITWIDVRIRRESNSQPIHTSRHHERPPRPEWVVEEEIWDSEENEDGDLEDFCVVTKRERTPEEMVDAIKEWAKVAEEWDEREKHGGNGPGLVGYSAGCTTTRATFTGLRFGRLPYVLEAVLAPDNTWFVTAEGW